MPDIYDMQLDAYPSMSEVNRMLALAESNECEHKECEQAEQYYGTLETDFYYYWMCSDCGDEVHNEPDEDCYKDRER